MILDLVLSVILTFGAGGPSNNFNECPPWIKLKDTDCLRLTIELDLNRGREVPGFFMR
jgi:hypothetical protein